MTGLFSSLLLWRVRFLVRGDVGMGRAEATGFGILMATIMGGTIWFLLAATTFVFNEDIVWSICLTIGSIFALLGVMERPSWPRVILSGVLILCANLDRATTGWACVVGAGLIALWFLLGFGGAANRRWFLPLLAAALTPLIISCVVNYANLASGSGFRTRSRCGLTSTPIAENPRRQSRRRGGPRLHSYQSPHVLSTRRSELQQRLSICWPAHKAPDGRGWRALRQALSDEQPHCFVTPALPAQSLGARHPFRPERSGGPP